MNIEINIQDKVGNFMSIRRKLIYNIFIFMSIPFVLALCYIFFYKAETIKKDYEYQIQQNLNKCANLINSELTLYIDKSNYILSNSYILNGLDNDYKDDLKNISVFYDNLDMLISGLQKNYEGSQITFTIYTTNNSLWQGKYVDKFEYLSENDFAKQLLLIESEKTVWGNKIESFDGEMFATFYRKIGIGFKNLGVLKVKIPFYRIINYLNTITLPGQGKIIYKDAAGSVYYQSDSIKQEMEDSKNIVKQLQLNNGHTIVAIVPDTQLQSVLFEDLITTIFVFIFIILFVIFMAYMISKRITKGLEDFVNCIKSDEELLFVNNTMKINEEDELFFIKEKFSEVITLMNNYHNDAIINQKMKNAFEIEMLQSKINPHLLYNSLSVIRWIGIKNNNSEITEIIDVMINYYRAVLSKGESIVSIKQEIDMIKEYIKINEYAHDNKYNFITEIEPDILEFYIVKLILQPIVENAILHGLNGRDNAILRIKGYFEGEYIIFEVIDNGYGMDNEVITRILDFNYTSNYGGYGLKNTIKRIELYYGDACGIDIHSSIGGGTTVKIKVLAVSQDKLVDLITLS